ncbi:MAG: DUF4476 domain-containing protein [Ferruginibacter sp.]
MKYLTFSLLFLMLFSIAFSQQNHFVYIQTENTQAFYVRVSDRLLSSSSSGYVVIPKLQNGSYDLNIGFPKNEWATQKIKLVINNKDAGYVLKNFDAKGWGLFNMQSMDIVMSSPNSNSNVAIKDDPDGFADVLADVVSTPSIKQKPQTKEDREEKNETPVKTVTTDDKPFPVIVENKVLSLPKKISSTLDNSGRSLIYIDFQENRQDTIRIFIPYASTEAKQVEKPLPVNEKKEQTKAEPGKVEATDKKTDEKFIDMEVPNSKVTSTDSVIRKEADKNNSVIRDIKVETKSAMINSDCKELADNDDFLKLRKKMAAQKTDENMIVIARKAFVSKCFTTDHVSNLSVLFLKDEGRYNFFDAAYSRVSDSQNFGVLVSKLSDEYYLNRFKAMIRK